MRPPRLYAPSPLLADIARRRNRRNELALRRKIRKIGQTARRQPARGTRRDRRTRPAKNARRMTRVMRRGRTTRSDLNHLEIFLAGSAFGTGPVDRNVLPARAGRDALVGQSRLLVVDPAADQAHPASVFHTYAASIGRLKLGHDGTVLPCRCLASHRPGCAHCDIGRNGRRAGLRAPSLARRKKVRKENSRTALGRIIRHDRAGIRSRARGRGRVRLKPIAHSSKPIP